jgi:hypothetical protein
MAELEARGSDSDAFHDGLDDDDDDDDDAFMREFRAKRLQGTCVRIAAAVCFLYGIALTSKSILCPTMRCSPTCCRAEVCTTDSSNQQ